MLTAAVMLEALVLDAMRERSRERWWIPPLFRAALARELREAFARIDLTHEELLRLLKLIVVFEAESAYGEVAESVIEILRSIPAAIVRIEAIRGRSTVTERELEILSRFVARERTKRAPRIDERADSGVKLKELRPPIDREELRARSGTSDTRRFRCPRSRTTPRPGA